ncbi:hypothetical protein SKAU_G00325200 [Synaphobranchus kaupii]|uniref:Uncharacterized protein n=1 Tax=Synaphobranchus kaupii TaxID=118154 RepID=A0A9Q1EPM4_SYNKA|nr:hypothetical protein SKAU_G00325200 [Synaphobranchus kaupii]
MKNKKISPGITEYDIAETYHLGYVGTYEELSSFSSWSRSGDRKDHFIPTAALAIARKDLNKLQNSKLYSLLKEENKEVHLAMQVLYQDHRTALTTGNSMEGKVCRALLADTIVNGNAETLLKQAMIMANPITSRRLRSDAGISRNSTAGKVNSLSEDGTNCYHKTGYNQIISEYQKKGIIEQGTVDRLKTWVKEDRHLSINTPEYKQILQRIRP